jgi:hypothetical protein
MEVKTFETFIKEGIGAITMDRTPSDKLNNPDHNIAQSRPIPMGQASSIPMHWGGGPGSRHGSRYGSNPTLKKRALTYTEFMTASKKHTNESEDFNWDDILKIDSDTEDNTTEDKWSVLEKDMMKIVDKHSRSFGDGSYGVIDAIYQVMDGMFEKIDRK